MGVAIIENIKKADLPLEYSQIVKHTNDAFAYFNDCYEDFREQTRIVMLDEQWDPGVVTDRELNSKPSLVNNLLYPFASQIIGEYMDFSPGLVVRGNYDAIEQKAELAGSLIRQIFYESKFVMQCQTILQHQLIGGFGGWEVYREYENPMSFNQKLMVRALDEPTSATWDPAARDRTKSDARFSLKLYRMPRDKFDKTYPEYAGAQSFPYYGYLADSTSETYNTNDDIVICKFFYMEERIKKIVQLSDGETCLKKDANDEIEKRYSAQIRQFGTIVEKVEVVAERDSYDKKVIESDLVNNCTLDTTIFPGNNNPLIFVDGHSTFVDGQQYFRSYTKGANDLQRLLNYITSELATFLLNSERTSWLVTPDNIAGFEDDWDDTSNNKPYKIANPDPRSGMPQHFDATPFPPALIELRGSIVNAIRETLNHYQQMNGGSGRTEESGVAIRTKIKQGNKNPNIYVQNLNNSTEQLGRVLLGAMSEVYDTTRLITVRDKEDRAQRVLINEPHYGGEYLNEIKIDEFSVTVESGGNFEAQKMEELSMLLSYLPNDPQLAVAFRDLIIGLFNLDKKEQFIERARAMLPPEIKAVSEGLPPPPPQPTPEQLLEEQKINNEMAHQAIKQEELQFKREKMMMDARNAELNQRNAEIKANAEIANTILKTKQAQYAHARELHRARKEEEALGYRNENNALKKFLFQ